MFYTIIKHLVMDVSSQSLKLKRWSNVIFDYAVFTNLSLDHVGDDEHDSFEDYKYCKSLLFKQCKTGIFNIDSEYYQDMIKDVTCNIYTFGKSEDADYRVVDCKNIMSGGFVGIDETIEEVAVNMLYDMIKNPVWYDCNKQMAAIKFLLFLEWNNALFVDGEKRISDALLVALILMIEKSRDEDKEMIIRTALICIC